MSNKERNARMNAVISSVAAIEADFADGSTADYLIVSDEKDADGDCRILYSSEQGRELLSAAFARPRKKRGVIDGRRFSVSAIRFPEHNEQGTEELIIDREAGIIRKCRQKRKKGALPETREVLLYSLRTDRYENIKASKNRRYNEFYIGIDKFRDYVKQHGKPIKMPRSE